MLRRSVRARLIEPREARQALTDLAGLGLERYVHDDLVDRIWALRDTLGAYDAAYVVLAEALDAELVTADAALAAAKGHRARVVLVG